MKPRVRWPIAIVWLIAFMACVYGWITYVLLDCNGDFESGGCDGQAPE